MKPLPEDLARAKVELVQVQRKIHFLSNDLCATVDLLELEESPALEVREGQLLDQLHQLTHRRHVLRAMLGLKPLGRWKPQVIR